MSVAVDLAGLSKRIAEYGPAAFLVTVGDDGPHVVSVAVAPGESALLAVTGRRTRANVAARPGVTLLWPAHPGGAYSLLVDGTATVLDGDDGTVAIEPTSGVLHRVADAAGSGPTCLPMAEPPPPAGG
jgi:Pyridoxamine 5'-phosphate oxidase